MAATWLADVLRAAGLTVDESQVPDWKQRGHSDGPFNPVGVLGHHTAGGASGDLPSLATVRDGRSNLAGPLAQLMLSRAGVWVPIAAGRCWHAGAADNRAAWPWVPGGDGNGYLIGVEAESSGTGDWTSEQLDSYPRGVAALLAHMGAGPDRFLGHKEWAPSRKPDPAGWPGDMNGFRATLANQGDDMFSDADRALLNEVRDRIRGNEPDNDILQRIKASTGDVWTRIRGAHPAMDSLQVIQWQLGQLAAQKPGGLTADDVAALVPESIAAEVVALLGQRLNTPTA